MKFFFCGAPDAPEDQAICPFAGLLANPDMPLSHTQVNTSVVKDNHFTSGTEHDGYSH